MASASLSQCQSYAGVWCEAGSTPTPTSPSPAPPSPSLSPAGCGQCLAKGENCYVSTWSVPCMASASQSQCQSYAGVWCEAGSTPTPTSPSPAPPSPSPPSPQPSGPAPPPGVCLGDEAVDDLLAKADVSTVTGLSGPKSVY